MEAIEREEAEQAKINAKFAKLAEALGWHDLAKKLRNPHYFHHEILFDGDGSTKSDGKSREAGGTGLERLVNTIRGRGYLQKYKGSLKDICANYALVTAGVRAQMLQDIAIMETLADIKEKYDKAGELRKTLKPGEKLSDVVPEGYAVYDPLGGGLVETGGGANMETLIAMAAEQTAEEAETLAKDLMGPDIYKQSGLRGDIANKITEMLAARGNQLMVIPKELKAVLTRAAEKRKTNKFMRALYKLTHGWKLWTLYSPFRTIKYNLRNLSGDMDALLAGNPRAYKKVGRSIADLINVMFWGKEAEGDIRDYMERGWAQSTESHNLMDDGQLTFGFEEEEIQRLIDLQKQAEAGKLNWKGLGKKSLKLLNKYTWGGIQHLTEFREQILRYACYLSYKEQMEADLKRGGEGRPDNWGASLKEEVMAVRDIRDRAYKMANELMGAYDQVSETGQKLRRFAVPFYSWLEVNARRYWRLLKNGLTSDSRKDFVAGFMKGTGMKTPLYAYRVARTYAMINLFSIAIKLINMAVNYGSGGADDELPPEVQQKPHITLGRDENGNVLYFDRLGSTADVMDWIGEDEALLPFVSTVKDILNGQQTVTGWIRQMGSAAYSKAFNALSPALKMPMEIATGKTYYPDATKPRMIRDMVDYAASTVGLSREVRALRGEPGPKYAEGVLDWLGQHASYAADPEEGAYFHILDRVRQFQERELGKTFDGAAITRRGEALRKLKTALRFNDKANIRRYLKEYYKLGGTQRGLSTSLDRMGPLAGLSREEQKQFLRWLPKEERKYLTKANQYYRELRSSLAR